jgi:hypothetical protein
MPHKIKYNIRVWKNGSIDIESEELQYATLGEDYHGLQYNHIGGTTKHMQIMERCSKITNLFKEIEELNKI